MTTHNHRALPYVLYLGILLGMTPAFTAAQVEKNKQLAPPLLSPHTVEEITTLGLEDPTLQKTVRVPLSIAGASLRKPGSQALLQNGTLRSETKSWDGFQWSTIHKTARTFENGLPRKHSSESYPPYPSRDLSTYSYDSLGRLSELLWHGTQRSLYSYDSAGRQLEILWTSLLGAPTQRQTFSYDTSGFLTEYVVQVYDVGSWANLVRRTYVNDGNGWAVSSLYMRWLNNAWTDQSRSTYTRDTSGNLTVLIVEDWSNNSWVSNSKTTYDYNAAGQVTEVLYYYWAPSAWNESRKDITIYDLDGDLLQILMHFWNGMNWYNYAMVDFTKISGPSITVVHLRPEENFPPGTNLNFRWVATGVQSVDIDFSSDGGSNWEQIASSIPDTGDYNFNWQTPSTEYSSCKVRVSATGAPGITSENDGTFSVLNSFIHLPHTTGSVELSVFNNGYLGDDGGSTGAGFRYKGKETVLWSGGVFYGTSSMGVVGMIRSFSIEDLQNKTTMGPFQSDLTFDQISSVEIQEKGPYPTLGVEISQKSHSRTGDDFVICAYTIHNLNATALSDFYVGCFLDWDIGSPSTNLGGYDSLRSLAYQHDTAIPRSDSAYYGVVALNGMAGARVTPAGGSRIDFFSYISTFLNEPVSSPSDYRTFIGSGPFSVPAGGARTVGFALVAGDNLDSLKAHADQARALWTSGVITNAPIAMTPPAVFSLEQNYPNPFNPSTSIRFALPRRSHVNFTVLDLLGREVRTLLNETMPSGIHTIDIDMSALPTGVYFYLIDTDGFRQTKKMVLIK